MVQAVVKSVAKVPMVILFQSEAATGMTVLSLKTDTPLRLVVEVSGAEAVNDAI